MSLTRADLIAAVTGEFAPVVALAGFAVADTSGNMKEPTDNALLAMGFAYGDLATEPVYDGTETQAIAYLSYFTVAKAHAALVAAMDIGASGATIKQSQQFAHITELLARTLAVAQTYGLQVPGALGTGFVPIPYAGGVSASDYLAVATDGDRMPPLFSPRRHPFVRAEVAT